jgi:hypothetical protein
MVTVLLFLRIKNKAARLNKLMNPPHILLRSADGCMTPDAERERNQERRYSSVVLARPRLRFMYSRVMDTGIT